MSSLCKVFLVAIYASLGAQALLPTHHSTHRTRHLHRSRELKTFHPESTFKTFGAQGLESPVPLGLHDESLPSNIQKYALEFIRSYLGVGVDQVAYYSGFSRGTQSFAYVHQIHDGVRFANAVANIAWNEGKVVACGSSFVNPSKFADSKPTVTAESIIPNLESALGGTYNNYPIRLEYLFLEDGTAALTYVVQIINEMIGTWFEAFADAHSGELLSVTDFVAQDTYTVVPIDQETFLDGVQVVENPQDLNASHAGWHHITFFFNLLEDESESTRGNNIYAYTDLFQSARETSPHLNFNAKYDDAQDPKVSTNKQAATVNAFYVGNSVHDITYRYGFTEEAFNFQWNNFGKGGKEHDRVQLSVQDPSGTNNANFATPPDGQSGVCRMFIWNFTTPNRDGAMENDIVSHEMTHGVSNRLTGGGTGRCLQTLEAGGMGEGWSDAMADWLNKKSRDVPDFVMGQYVTNNPAGIRSHPYSTNPKVNPLTYSSIAKLNEVHQIGEVWANMLHNVYAALVEALNFSHNARLDPTTSEGNVVFMHLFIDSFSIQPCNPTYAWIQADQSRYSGKNRCTIYKAFASRGLGSNAKTDHVDNFDVPADC